MKAGGRACWITLRSSDRTVAALGTCILALAALLTGCATTRSTVNSTPAKDLAYIDHIILTIDDLQRGMDLLEQATGVRPVFGGAHPGRGTQNALLSLGNNQYIELLAPNLADTSATAQATADRRKSYFSQFTKPVPNGWAIRVTNADAERARFVERGFKASEVQPGSRAKPDGQTLRWKTFDPWGLGNQLFPFAIEWGEGTPHPAATSPSGCRLVDFSMESTAADSTRAMFVRAGYPLTITPGASDRLTVTIECPKGRVTFP